MEFGGTGLNKELFHTRWKISLEAIVVPAVIILIDYIQRCRSITRSIRISFSFFLISLVFRISLVTASDYITYNCSVALFGICLQMN